MMHDVQKSYEDPYIQLHNADLHHLMRSCRPTTTNVYLALHIRANRKAGNTCFPSLNTIAKEAHVSRRTVQSAIEELEKAGFVSVENRMSAEGDATSNRYWLRRPSANFARGGEDSATPVGQEIPQGVGQPLPSNHTNTYEANEPEPKDDRLRQEFESFWSHYPRKTDKDTAWKAWQKLNPSPELQTTIGVALAQQIANNWHGKDKSFIPHGSTWLNRKRWEDEILPPEPDKYGNITPLRAPQHEDVDTSRITFPDGTTDRCPEDLYGTDRLTWFRERLAEWRRNNPGGTGQ